MATVPNEQVEARNPPSLTGLIPANTDKILFGMLAAAFLILFLPTYSRLSGTIWQSDEQGHGPIILAVSAWLLFQKRHALAALPAHAGGWGGWTLLGGALLFFILGHSQGIISLEVAAQILFLGGVILVFKGPAGLRLCWFSLFFLIFMIPLPGPLVAAVTTPLKSAVSAVSAFIMHALGYPIGRSGVILTIGQYQLLVADACAGLNSMFTLEALVLLYINLMKYKSPVRNVMLALSAIPISFLSNIFRVIILVLVTYYFGDEAGQGFVHDFAGMVLFIVALALTIMLDGVYGFFVKDGSKRK